MKKNKVTGVLLLTAITGLIIFLVISCSDFNPWVAGGVEVPQDKNAPEINVRQDSVNIESGSGEYIFPRVIVDGNDGQTSGYVTFTIENTGEGELTINKLSIGDSTDFDLLDKTDSPVPPSGSTTFSIRFDPFVFGNKSTTVTIENNDPDESEYTFTVTGCGIIVRRMGGSSAGGDKGTSITTGNANQIIITGYVDGTVDLNGDGDRDDGAAETTPFGSSNEIFISCFDYNFNFTWALRRGGIG